MRKNDLIATTNDMSGVIILDKTLPQRFLRYIIAILGMYEAVAIVTEKEKLPTISAIAWKCREDPIKRALVLFPVWSWLTFHLFTDGPQTLEEAIGKTCACIDSALE